MASQGRTGLPDKIPIIIHDQDERETHYIFAKRPEPSEGPYTVLIAFNTKQGVPSKHRILIEYNTIIRDITVRGRFVIQNDTSDYVDEMATSSEFAGARMNKAFEKLSINIGNALQPTGAAIQDFATNSIRFLDADIENTTIRYSPTMYTLY
jgi:hypothetical protein